MRAISDAFVIIMVCTCLANLTKKTDKAWYYFFFIVVMLGLGFHMPT